MTSQIPFSKSFNFAEVTEAPITATRSYYLRMRVEDDPVLAELVILTHACLE